MHWAGLSKDEIRERIAAGEYIHIEINNHNFWVISWEIASSGSVRVEWYSDTEFTTDEEKTAYDSHVSNALMQILKNS